MDDAVAGAETAPNGKTFRNVVTTGHLMIFGGLVPIIGSALYIAFIVGVSYSNLQSALAMETANRIAAESSIRNDMASAFNSLAGKIENSASLAKLNTENIRASLEELKSNVKTLTTASTPSHR